MVFMNYSTSTWILILGPLAVFLVITVWVIELLAKAPPWYPAIPIVIGFAVVFLALGVLIRAKLGKIVF
ncbi:hypothetical protein DJ531_10145 [Sulfolobus sp. A20-N-F6]|nr:hypothetical protein [Sulfolobus sp. B1]TRM74258.1 hypothetical protein DJ523_05305 [Sulfolobus sp. E5]TRM78603.1 hypothetical protein DJ532_00765 [Sulfolobus sp. A20-N-F8]TRM81964.1 hypothetical protein DJ531_10145 [Sulfolobus sp. A20-N-F6]TRM82091.1 hypothetical protein DJ524_01880 [Sulfolobus sp. D5]TRM84658.1 hypothetical protein DJ522_03920 [Sulfolobus sp. F3]TRM88257.1 hypothetical protein DJ521_02195 [Sulfolobus sp. E3]TRM89816.1 hypothetical protein DJ529_00035 [Sulfolobus sp. C3]